MKAITNMTVQAAELHAAPTDELATLLSYTETLISIMNAFSCQPRNEGVAERWLLAATEQLFEVQNLVAPILWNRDDGHRSRISSLALLVEPALTRGQAVDLCDQMRRLAQRERLGRGKLKNEVNFVFGPPL